MSVGFHDRILRVNLTTGAISIESPGEKFFRTYFGGRNLIGYYLLQEVGPETDPMGPQNRLIFAPGIITGTPVGGNGRNSVGAKSPLTGGWGEAEAGGFFGAELKAAGYDAIIIQGQSPEPVYLEVRPDQVVIRPANHLWGQLVSSTHSMLVEELGDKFLRTALIGPAGENLVRFAAIVNDIRYFAARTGLGAVMGSKRLKGIAVRSTSRMTQHDPKAAMALAKWMAKHWRDTSEWRQTLGTPGAVMPHHLAGGLPANNYQSNQFPHAEDLSGERMNETILIGKGTCYACPIQCKRDVASDNPVYPVKKGLGGPEYETLASLGSNLGISDLVAVSHANQLCGEYGMDTISAGVVIAWAMECTERSILTSAETDGLAFKFGSPEVMVEALHRIAHRKGIGDLLAEGVRIASQKLGRGSDEFAMHVKGQETPLHEPRLKHSMALAYSLSPSGADHTQGSHDTYFYKEGPPVQAARSFGVLEPQPLFNFDAGKIRLFVYQQYFRSMLNSVGMCLFLPWTLSQLTDVVNSITGWNCSDFELMKIGEKGLALSRAFNVREGFGPDQDSLPKRFFEAFPDGPIAGRALTIDQFEQGRRLYYGMVGWNRNGVPTNERLAELDLDWVAKLQ